MFPVNRLNMIKKAFDPQLFSHGVSNSIVRVNLMVLL